MKSMFFTLAAACSVALAVTGCKSVPREATVPLEDVHKLAWSLKDGRDGMVVNISPTGNALRFGGTAGLVVGTSVDAVANDRYRQQIEEALGSWNVGDALTSRITARLQEVYTGEATEISPLGSTTQYASRREGEAARLEALAKQGYGQVLDLDVTYGVYGPNGVVAVQIEARQYDLSTGKLSWKRSIVTDTTPILATAPLGDPISAVMTPSVSDMRLKAEADAVTQWTMDGGAPLKAAFDGVINDAVSALLCGTGLVEEANGLYALGRDSMNDKEFAEADGYFGRALALDSSSAAYRNGRAVNTYHSGNRAEAITQTEALVADVPDFAPGWFNLAWYYAEAGNTERAQACYDKAQSFGLASTKKIDKALEQ